MSRATLKSLAEGLRLGELRTHQNLCAIPILPEDKAAPAFEYLTLEDALNSRGLSIDELERGGSVSKLRARNDSDSKILLVDGDLLEGAKQNRVVSASVLIPPRSELILPVKCVERGRWADSGKRFESAESSSPALLRQKQKAMLVDSLRETQSHEVDQSAVWSEVTRTHTSTVTSSISEDLLDAFKGRGEALQAYVDAFPIPEQAIGLACLVGGRLVSLDVFDRPATLRRHWPKLIRGAALNAIEADSRGGEAPIPDTAELLAFLKALGGESCEVEEHDAVGLGRDLSLRGEALVGTALCFAEDPSQNAAIVHLGVVRCG